MTANNEQKQHEYEQYLDELSRNQSPLPFAEWEKYYDNGELFLLDEEQSLRNFNTVREWESNPER